MVFFLLSRQMVDKGAHDRVVEYNTQLKQQVEELKLKYEQTKQQIEELELEHAQKLQQLQQHQQQQSNMYNNSNSNNNNNSTSNNNNNESNNTSNNNTNKNNIDPLLLSQFYAEEQRLNKQVQELQRTIKDMHQDRDLQAIQFRLEASELKKQNSHMHSIVTRQSQQQLHRPTALLQLHDNIKELKETVQLTKRECLSSK